MIEASVMRTVWNDGKTGYEVQGVSARPYEKKGLFGFLKK